jgi:hypothetical protein
MEFWKDRRIDRRTGLNLKPKPLGVVAKRTMLGVGRYCVGVLA